MTTRARQLPRRQHHLGRLAAAPGRRALGFAPQREGHPTGQGDQARHDEGGAPAPPLHQQPREQGRAGHAQIARQAVDADDHPGAAGPLHEHGDAHRMINGREETDERQPRRKLPWPLRQRGEQRRRPQAEEEDQHHLPPAPEIAQATGRHGPQAEQEEGPHAVRHQVFPAGKAEFRRDRADGRREDQQEQMIERMADIEQQRDPAGMVFERGLRLRRR